MASPSSDLPLSGLRVLDFAQFLAGPAAALRLADLGAEVIKIERRQGGDACRGLAINDQMLEGDSLLFHTFNRNKKSITADLKSPEDLDRIKALIKTADVMIQNLRPGVMERIGLGYDDVSKLNPKLVYGSVSGYGSTGPWANKPGQDLLAQALSGMCYLQGNASDGPVPTGFALLDITTGMNLVQGILAALLRRSVTGKGGLVEVELLTSAIDLQFEQLTAFFNDNNRLPQRSQIANANVYGAAPYGIFETQQGYLALAMTPLSRLAELLDAPEIAAFDQARAFEQRDAIKSILATILTQKTVQEWLAILEPADIWCAEVLTWQQLAQSDGFKALEPLQTVTTANGKTAVTTRCPIRLDSQILTSPIGAPALGADTSEVLAALAAQPQPA